MNIKNILILAAAIVVIAGAVLFMTKNQVKAPIQSIIVKEEKHEPIPAIGDYELNTSSSTLEARGAKPLIPGYVDAGTVNFKEGHMTLTDGIISGNFKIDMNSITIESTGKKSGESMLEKHLKSADFFDVGKYPESMFEIKSAEKTVEDNLYKITGDLTIKGIKKSISFPAVIYMKDKQLKAEGTIALNRTQWDIRYGSGTFFGDLGDKAISDIFTIEFHIIADPTK